MVHHAGWTSGRIANRWLPITHRSIAQATGRPRSGSVRGTLEYASSQVWRFAGKHRMKMLRFSVGNRLVLDELPDHDVLPRKGRLSKADRERGQDAVFVAMRRQHPAVESAIDNLEHQPGPCLRSRWLCPRGGAFNRGLQHPPYRPAPKGGKGGLLSGHR